jgi:hypothetical protein
MAPARQGPDWVCVNPQADWQARDSMGDFLYRDQLDPSVLSDNCLA